MKFINTVFLALAVLALAACGPKAETLPATRSAPKFESAAANSFVTQYSGVANEIAAAYKAKDYAKVASLSPKLADVTGKISDVIKELKDTDAKTLQDWIASVTQQLADTATASGK